MNLTKTQLEEILTPLGENPAAEIQRLQQAAAELQQLKPLLSDMMQRGLQSALYELPSADHQILHWGWLDNERLKDDRSEFSAPEKMRRSFLGLQEYNLSVEPGLKFYADRRVLSAVADVSSASAQHWMRDHQSEIDAYNDLLQAKLDEPDNRPQHNSMALEYSPGKQHSDLIKWPARYYSA